MLGLDPEFCLTNKRYGTATSAHRFLKQKIHMYEPPDSKTMHGAEMDRDGPSLEVRSLVRTECRDNIVPYVAEAMRLTQLRLNKWLSGAYRLDTKPMYVLNKASFNGKVPEDVRLFGCNPDIDAYTLLPKSPTLVEGDLRRYTGGHIHSSTWINLDYDTNKYQPEAEAAIAILHDYFLGLPLVAILGEKYAAGEAERRKFYGQAGSYRFDKTVNKFEYRVPSGRLMLHPLLLGWALGVSKLLKGTFYRNSMSISARLGFLKSMASMFDPAMVVQAINQHDWLLAERLYGDIYAQLPNYGADKSLEYAPSGSGTVDLNPHFFKTVVDLFVAGNHAGLMWDDDLTYNWGLYDSYRPTHHKYWGIHAAMNGYVDDKIFPQGRLLSQFVPKEHIIDKPLYTHPLAGGKARWVTQTAINWLS